MKRSDRIVVAVVLLVGIGLRVGWALQPGYSFGFDAAHFKQNVDRVRAGENIYVDQAWYPYSPVWIYVETAIDIVRGALPFDTATKLVLFTAELATAITLGRIADSLRPGTGALAFMVLWFAPTSLLLIGISVQFEIVALLPLVIGVYLAVARPQSRQRDLTIWVLGTLAAVIKQPAAFGAWVLFVYTFGPRRAILLAVGTAITFFATLVPFLPASGVWSVVTYASAPTATGFRELLGVPTWFSTFVLLGFSTVLPLLSHRRGLDLPTAMMMQFVAFCVFATGIFIHYWLYPTIWTTIRPTKWSLGLLGLIIPVELILFVASGYVPQPYNVLWLYGLIWLIITYTRREAVKPTDSAGETISVQVEGIHT